LEVAAKTFQVGTIGEGGDCVTDNRKRPLQHFSIPWRVTLAANAPDPH